MTDEPMIATKDKLGAYDAIESAKPGEPLFPVQGGDPFGPLTVLHWASLARAAGLAETNQTKAANLLSKASDAEVVAWVMMAYQRGEPIVAPEGDRARYNDAPVMIDADADQERKTRAAMITASGRLSDIVARGTEIIDTLAALRVHPEEEVQLREAIETIRQAAFGIEPRRAGERS